MQSMSSSRRNAESNVSEPKESSIKSVQLWLMKLRTVGTNHRSGGERSIQDPSRKALVEITVSQGVHNPHQGDQENWLAKYPDSNLFMSKLMSGQDFVFVGDANQEVKTIIVSWVPCI